MQGDERVEGTVLDWSERGFGFITVSDGRRAYVHHSQFGGGNLEKGESVTAVIVEDTQNPGKWAAHDVQRMPNLRMEGTVVQWNQRGFGFIQVADGRRAYVHASQFDGEHLQDGETVTAVITEDAQNAGKWAAMDVQRVSVGSHANVVMQQRAVDPWMGMAGADYGAPAATYHAPSYGYGAGSQPQPGSRDAAGHFGGASLDRVEGEITEWNERGFGFMKTSDGRKVYVHHSSFGGGNLQAGVTVNAIVQEDRVNPGKWAASDVQLGLLSRTKRKAAPGLQPQPWGAMHSAGGNGMVAPEQEGWTPPASHSQAEPGHYPNQRVEGYVVQWNERGFGFIELADKTRAYVHSSFFGGGDLAVGDMITCVVEEDRQNPGKWCARHVQKGPAAEDGELISWNQQGGFGFLTLDDGRRAYIHASIAAGDLEVGTRLRVRTKADPKNPGKWCVAEVLEMHISRNDPDEMGGLAPPDHREIDDAPAVADGVLMLGSVAEWDPRGFGFVLLEDSRRAYVHHSAFGGGHLFVGEGVEVTVAPDRRNPGKLMVTTMVREADSAAAAAEAALDTSSPPNKRARLVK